MRQLPTVVYCSWADNRSGSGKTISCNHSIEYLAARGSSGGDLADKLVSASTVLEAFGNAPTVHNANSSRYAKVVNVRSCETLTPS